MDVASLDRLITKWHKGERGIGMNYNTDHTCYCGKDDCYYGQTLVAEGWRAREYAAHFQSPGTVGKWMSQLASTGSVQRGNILTDIARTRDELEGSGDDVRRELDYLEAWARADIPCGWDHV